MSVSYRLRLGLLVVLAGCVDLSPADGTVRCNPTGKACPDAYQCASDGLCYRGTPNLDMGMNMTMNDLSMNMNMFDLSGVDQTAPPPDMTPACAAIQVSTFSGSGVAGLVNGVASVVQFNDPKGITVDSGGTLYVADNGNKVVRKVAADGSATTFAGGGTGTQAFYTSWRVAAGGFGTVYMVDQTNDNVQYITSGGVASTLFSQGAVISVAVDPNTGYIYDAVGCGNITKWISGPLTTVTSLGSCGFMDGSAAVAQFDSPVDIAVDNGVIYVADNGNFRIRKVLIADGTTSTLARLHQGPHRRQRRSGAVRLPHRRGHRPANPRGLRGRQHHHPHDHAVGRRHHLGRHHLCLHRRQRLRRQAWPPRRHHLLRRRALRCRHQPHPQDPAAVIYLVTTRQKPLSKVEAKSKLCPVS